MRVNIIYNEHCLTGLKKLKSNSIDCFVTSPPYYGLRDYGVKGQLGMEETPELYVKNLVKIFREVRRVLKPEGTLWLNLGDSYWGGKGKSGASWDTENNFNKINPEATNIWKKGDTRPIDRKHPFIKPKDLIGIPWMVAFALRMDGWYLRQEIIWHKPNPMPESVTDRCTKSHEQIFLLTKSSKYYFDAEAIKTEVADATVKRFKQNIEAQKGSNRVPGKTNGAMKAVGMKRNPRKGIDIKGGNQGAGGIPALCGGISDHSGYFDKNGNLIGNGKANKKSVWTVPTKPFKEAHFATFPEDLIKDCVLAGCPPGGVVCDPFMGAATTAVVCKKLKRRYIGFELNKNYIKISNARLAQIR